MCIETTLASKRGIDPFPRVGIAPVRAREPGRDLSTCEARLLRPDELPMCGRLRHGFFVREKGWTRCDGDIELDAWDAHALHLGVYMGGALVGYMRALAGDGPVGFMLDADFRPCLTDAEHARLRRAGSVELSRWVLAPTLGPVEACAVARLLFQLFYVVALEHRFEVVYLVQEPAQATMFERLFGLRFTPVNARPHTFPDGTTVNVDHATVAGMREGLRARGRFDAFERFRQGYSATAAA